MLDEVSSTIRHRSFSWCAYVGQARRPCLRHPHPAARQGGARLVPHRRSAGRGRCRRRGAQTARQQPQTMSSTASSRTCPTDGQFSTTVDGRRSTCASPRSPRCRREGRHRLLDKSKSTVGLHELGTARGDVEHLIEHRARPVRHGDLCRPDRRRKTITLYATRPRSTRPART